LIKKGVRTNKWQLKEGETEEVYLRNRNPKGGREKIDDNKGERKRKGGGSNVNREYPSEKLLGGETFVSSSWVVMSGCGGWWGYRDHAEETKALRS